MTDQSSIIELEGAYGLRDAEGLKTQILGLFDQARSIQIETRGLTDIDVSIVQILFAAQASAAERGIRLGLKAPAGGVLSETLRRGGFLCKPQSRAPLAAGTASHGEA